MEIEKSTRHSYIIGKFGEYLLCNWLSRTGFEVTLVDHTGLDVIAFDAKTGQRLGITVKSRSRNTGKENEHVNVLSYAERNNDRDKLCNACKAFAAVPWIAVYVETGKYADLYLTSLDHFDMLNEGRKTKRHDVWRMSSAFIALYGKDPDVYHIKADFSSENWFERELR